MRGSRRAVYMGYRYGQGMDLGVFERVKRLLKRI